MLRWYLKCETEYLRKYLSDQWELTVPVFTIHSLSDQWEQADPKFSQSHGTCDWKFSLTIPCPEKTIQIFFGGGCQEHQVFHGIRGIPKRHVHARHFHVHSVGIVNCIFPGLLYSCTEGCGTSRGAQTFLRRYCKQVASKCFLSPKSIWEKYSRRFARLCSPQNNLESRRSCFRKVSKQWCL